MNEHRDPADLRPHPILKNIPAPPKNSAAEIAATGALLHSDHLLPIIIDQAGQILTDDSRLRWLAARRAGLETVPVTIQPGELAPAIALAALLHRAHYTADARAYLAVPFLKPAFEAARERRLEYLKSAKTPIKGMVSSRHHSPPATVEELAESVGVSKPTLQRARQVHAAFDSDKKPYAFQVSGGAEDGATEEKTLREYFEPRILQEEEGGEHEHRRPMGLGAVLAGIAGLGKTYKKERGEPKQMLLFSDAMDSLSARFSFWPKLHDTEKAALRDKWAETIRKMPKDLLEVIETEVQKRLEGN